MLAAPLKRDKTARRKSTAVVQCKLSARRSFSAWSKFTAKRVLTRCVFAAWTSAIHRILWHRQALEQSRDRRRIVLVTTMFCQWRDFTRISVLLEKSVLVLRASRRAKVLNAWKNRAILASVVLARNGVIKHSVLHALRSHSVHSKNAKRLSTERRFFFLWLRSIREEKCKRQALLRALEAARTILLRNRFKTLKRNAHYYFVARSFYESKQLAFDRRRQELVKSPWKHTRSQARLCQHAFNRVRAAVFQSRELASCFEIMSRRVKAASVHGRTFTQKTYFKRWAGYATRIRIAERMLSVNVSRKCFILWRRLLSLKRTNARMAVEHRNYAIKERYFRLFEIVANAHFNENRANRHFLYLTFRRWRQNASCSAIAALSKDTGRHHWDARCKQTALECMIEYSRRRRGHRVAVHIVCAARTEILRRRVLCRWKGRIEAAGAALAMQERSRQRTRLQILYAWKQKSEKQKMAIAWRQKRVLVRMQNWIALSAAKRSTLSRRRAKIVMLWRASAAAARMGRFMLVRRTFQKWKDHLQNLCSISSSHQLSREKRIARRSFDAFVAYSQRCKCKTLLQHQSPRRVAHARILGHSFHAMETAWQTWRDRVSSKGVLAAWRAYAKARVLKYGGVGRKQAALFSLLKARRTRLLLCQWNAASRRRQAAKHQMCTLKQRVCAEIRVLEEKKVHFEACISACIISRAFSRWANWPAKRLKVSLLFCAERSLLSVFCAWKKFAEAAPQSFSAKRGSSYTANYRRWKRNARTSIPKMLRTKPQHGAKVSKHQSIRKSLLGFLTGTSAWPSKPCEDVVSMVVAFCEPNRLEVRILSESEFFARPECIDPAMYRQWKRKKSIRVPSIPGDYEEALTKLFSNEVLHLKIFSVYNVAPYFALYFVYGSSMPTKLHFDPECMNQYEHNQEIHGDAVDALVSLPKRRKRPARPVAKVGASTQKEKIVAQRRSTQRSKNKTYDQTSAATQKKKVFPKRKKPLLKRKDSLGQKGTFKHAYKTNVDKLLARQYVARASFRGKKGKPPDASLSRVRALARDARIKARSMRRRLSGPCAHTRAKPKQKTFIRITPSRKAWGAACWDTEEPDHVNEMTPDSDFEESSLLFVEQSAAPTSPPPFDDEGLARALFYDPPQSERAPGNIQTSEHAASPLKMAPFALNDASFLSIKEPVLNVLTHPLHGKNTSALLVNSEPYLRDIELEHETQNLSHAYIMTHAAAATVPSKSTTVGIESFELEYLTGKSATPQRR